MRRHFRFVLQLAVSSAVLAVIVSRIDVGRSFELVAGASLAPVATALIVLLATTVVLAWRWQVLLASAEIQEPLGWLTKTYLVAQAVGQVLPTALGGDAVRIVEHSRRRPGRLADVAAAVLIERVLGAAVTVAVGAAGLAVLAAYREDVRSYLWLEVGLAGLVLLVGAILFSRRVGGLLRRAKRLVAALRLERAAESLYATLHRYRDAPRALLAAAALSLVVQLARGIAIWLCAIASGIDLGPLPFVVLGSLLAVVMMLPLTLNGLGVREGFFVVFLSGFGVEADAAFAAGLLFFLLTIVATLPGAALLLGHQLAPLVRARFSA